MPKILRSPEIEGVVIVEPDVHADPRGTFVEPWRKEWFPGAPEMVQANRSDKLAGSLVGLHYHLHQADYWFALSGRARMVMHDLRASSPTGGTTLTVELSGDAHRGVYVPPGVGHGFAALTDFMLWYMVDAYYNPADELGVAWDDPELGLDWGILDPVLSDRDRQNPRLIEIAGALRPA
ncbi:MAG: dTDP-4-dehydrorhamnose 3,5-epimerase family protein [Acidimicrobiales bacterium]